MSLQSLVTYVSQLCVRHRVSLYTIARRYRWDQNAVEDFLHGQKAPTPKMLRDLARELDVSVQDLQNSLEATHP